MAEFHYVVRAKLIRNKPHEHEEIEFLEFEDKFEDINPIVARNKAFRHYQNYIDVFLQNRDSEYVSDKQARIELASFVNSGTSKEITLGNEQIEISDKWGNGIGVFLVINTPIPKEDTEDSESKVSDEKFIHGLGTINYYNDPDDFIYNLQAEYEYYKYFNYNTENREIKITYCERDEWEEGYKEDAINTYTIIETPFDWTGLDKPFWWKDNTTMPQTSINQSIKEIIKEGETNQVEFKPALLYNFFKKTGGIGIKAIIAKSICAFLNSNGGYLLIGVTDNGEIQGLSHDFSLSNKENKKDFFRNEFDQMLEHFLSFSIKHHISGDFHKIDDKEIYIVVVTPSNRPVFMNGKNEDGQKIQQFYVRGEASSREIKNLDELVNYCIDHWGTNNN